jgi:nicotinamide phosphoribosyltransferase
MCTRDSFGCAIKATYGRVNGEDRALFKAPKTDDGIKNSARGLLRIEREGDRYVLHEMQTWQQEMRGELREVFRDGAMLNQTTLTDIRGRLLG